MRSIPGRSCPGAAAWAPANPSPSIRASPRRPATDATWWCASSPAATSRPVATEAPVARVLIAEDEEALRAFVARALTMDGHEVMVAADGGEALDVLVREQGKFDVLLTDIRMPVMDGIALALATARDFPELTILLMTGYADQRERAHGLDALIHDVIAKPFSLEEIRKAVNGALVAKGG